jgi:subtilisin family serine protease
MKSLLTIVILFVFSTLKTFGQIQSSEQKRGWNELIQASKSFEKTGHFSPEAIAQFPIYHIHGTYYVSLFGKALPHANWNTLAALGGIVGKETGGVRTLKLPVALISSIQLEEYFSYFEIPAKAYPHLDRAVKDTHADSVQKGINLPAAFTGKDVFIGVTDWGFDYTHPMFYDTLLQTSRIHSAWDQFKQSGTSPQNYSYGVEFDTPQELLAAGSDTSNIYSYNTHGTHVGGIAGGSGAGLNYRGFGFESEFLFCTFLIDAASVIDGFNWMHEKAQAEGKRLVINMSWGLYYMGTLDGNSLLSQAMNDLSNQGVVFVSSAGNNGSVNFHIKHTFLSNYFQSKINFYDYNSNANMWGQSVSMWGEQNHDFSFVLKIYNASQTLLAHSDTISTATINTYIDTMLVVGSDTILYNVSGEHAHPLNGRPTMRLRVKNTNTALNVVLQSIGESGTVHYWNVTELTTGVGNWGMPFTSYATNGISGDANYSIGEPTCSPDAISVSAYSASYLSTTGNIIGGGIASFTSIGPLYTEEMKPDITAPGVSVASSISSFTDASYTAIATTNFNGTDYDFARFSGTSMSSPCVTGIVALILDANPTLMPNQIKTILKETARLDNYTGSITAPGDYRWGMGKVNAYAAIIRALNTLSVAEIASNNWVIAYPNPAQTNVQLLIPETETIEHIEVLSMDGKSIQIPVTNNNFDCSVLAPGNYIIQVYFSNSITQTHFVKN